MCEQLTSCGIKVSGQDAPRLAIHTTNSHSKTWQALNLDPVRDAVSVIARPSPWRELEWKVGYTQPDIRFCDSDDEEVKRVAMAFVLGSWQTRESFVEHCCREASYVYAIGCTGLTKLEKASR